MTTPSVQQEESLFDAALKYSNPVERRSFIERVCGGDRTLRERVEALIAAQKEDKPILLWAMNGHPLACT